MVPRTINGFCTSMAIVAIMAGASGWPSTAQAQLFTDPYGAYEDPGFDDFDLYGDYEDPGYDNPIGLVEQPGFETADPGYFNYGAGYFDSFDRFDAGYFDDERYDDDWFYDYYSGFQGAETYDMGYRRPEYGYSAYDYGYSPYDYGYSPYDYGYSPYGSSYWPYGTNEGYGTTGPYRYEYWPYTTGSATYDYGYGTY